MRTIDADALMQTLGITDMDCEKCVWRSRAYRYGQCRRGNDFEDACLAIKDAPTIEPQRMRGKWIYGEDEYGIDGYHCDKCGFFVPWDYAHTFINYIKDYNFCPNCGADMRGTE